MKKELVPSFTSELPDGWKETTIGDLIAPSGVFIDGDWIESKDQNPNGDIRLLQLADIGDGFYKNKSSRFLTKAKALELKCTFLKKGDVLVARMPDPLGRACIFPGDEKECVTVVDVCVIRTGIEQASHKWLLYWINSPRFRNTIASLQSGTTRRRISRRNLATITFPVPPPEQQKRIVVKIEELFSHIDAGIAALTQAKKLLKQYRQSVLKAAVTGELTKQWREENKDKLEPANKLLERIELQRNALLDQQVSDGSREAKRLKNKLNKHEFEELQREFLPEDWVSVSLLKLCQTVVDCHNKTAPYVEKGIPLIRTTNIRHGVINFEYKMKFITEQTYDYWSRRCPPMAGDILFTREAPMGESAVVPEGVKLCMGQRMMLLRVFHKFTNVKYLHFALMDPLFQRRFQNLSVGVGVQHLRVGDVEKSVIGLPPFLEQMEIVRLASSRLDSIDRLESDIDFQLIKTEKNKQSILASAFSGNLIRSSEGDGDVSELLNRIRASQAEEKMVSKTIKRPPPKSKGKIVKKPIVEILAEKGEIAVSALMQEAGYDLNQVESFYEELSLVSDSIDELRPEGKEVNGWPYEGEIRLKLK